MALSLNELFASIWEKKEKVPFEGVPFGSVILVRETEDLIQDDEDENDDFTITERVDYSVVIPFTDDLSAYKHKGKGYLCKAVGSDKPHIWGFRDLSEAAGEDRIVRKCVVLFNSTL